MKRLSSAAIFGLLTMLGSVATAHAEEMVTPSWHAQSLLQALANMVIFAVVGIIAAVAGFKIFDKCTPGDLTKEIIENKNVAAAVIGAAVILGVCLIVAAAMIG